MLEGTLEQYINLIKSGKLKPLSAHERLYYAFIKGRERGAFDHLIGMESVLDEFERNFLLPAVKGYDATKRLWLCVGPPGSGKSTFVQTLKTVLMDYAKTDDGAVYRLKGCPMQENPLWALPEAERAILASQNGISINGTLSPFNKQRLEQEYANDWRQLPVERFILSEQDRSGIGTFMPGDWYSQDLSDLIGDIDYAKVTQYGTSSDPRAYRYDGEIQVANQGMLELHEVLKCRYDLLYPFLTLAEESIYKVSRQAMIYSDQVLIGHTTETEWKSFAENKVNHSLLKRMNILFVPYNLKLEREKDHYHQYIHPDDRGKFAPRTLEILAQIAILSRLSRDENRRIYREIAELKAGRSLSVQKRDGLVGLDTRLVYRVLERCACMNGKVTAKTLIYELKCQIEEDLTIDMASNTWYEHIMSCVINEFESDLVELIETEITRRYQVELNRMVKSAMQSEQLLKQWFGLSGDTIATIREQWLSNEEVNSLSNLTLEYQQLFKHKLMQDVLQSLVSEDRLTIELADYLEVIEGGRYSPYVSELIKVLNQRYIMDR